jgi:hypothetical protein
MNGKNLHVYEKPGALIFFVNVLISYGLITVSQTVFLQPSYGILEKFTSFIYAIVGD